MVEETTAASHTLRKEADNLTQLIRQFNVGRQLEVPGDRSAGKPAARKAVPAGKPRLVSSAPKAAAGRSSVAAKAEEWQDF